jgi:outer membrane protein assembly factor BamB
MYDAMTGQWILDIANPNANMLVEGPNGELLSYTTAGGKLSLWNASKCIEEGSVNQIYRSYSPAETWRPPQGATIDWSGGYEWSVPIATNISGVPITPNLGVSAVDSDVVLLTSMDSSVPGGSQTGYRIDAGYSADDGHLLWGPINRTLTAFTNKPLGPAGEGVYTEYTCQSMSWIGYNIENGDKLWGPTDSYNNPWGYFDNNAHGVIGYGNLYVWGMSGEVYAYDVQTGALVWSWNGGSAGIDTPYGIWPLGTWSMQHILADGKLYVRAGHDYTPPVFKGAKLYAINATTGEEIWNSLSFNIISCPAIADGVMVWDNGYDNQIYAYGKGPSRLTVDAPSLGVSTSSPITIRGTITDISAGAQQQAVAANFPNGLPCVSDASQSQFMEAVYQQQPMPANLTGVPITINVVDANGNYRTIGTTLSNGYGSYSLTWTPDIPGDYTVIANFAGTESYYSSEAATAFYASEPAATPTPESTQIASIADQYFLPLSIGMIVSIVVIGAILALLLLRKRP